MTTSPVARALRMLPDAVLRRVLPARLGFDGATGHELTFPDASVRLFIGPVNFAGQGWAWARAAERLPDVSAVSMSTVAQTGFAYDVDQAVPPSVFQLSRRWNQAQLESLRTRATHVILEAGRPLLGYGSTPLEEIDDLRAHGVRVALLGHGSDVRDGERHRRSSPDSPYHDGGWGDREPSERRAATHRGLIASARVPTYVSTPGLLDDVPDAIWLPVVVDVDRWHASRSVLETDVPLVVHAPSSTAVKGTELIEPQLLRLASDGLIQYRRIQGVHSSEMPSLIRQADIVLDQFRLGDYGVAACEAMAAGRVVVGNVEDSVRLRVRENTGLDLPILQARAEQVEATLRRILADRGEARAFAGSGTDFARAVHDGRLSAAALQTFLES